MRVGRVGELWAHQHGSLKFYPEIISSKHSMYIIVNILSPIFGNFPKIFDVQSPNTRELISAVIKGILKWLRMGKFLGFFSLCLRLFWFIFSSRKFWLVFLVRWSTQVIYGSMHSCIRYWQLDCYFAVLGFWAESKLCTNSVSSSFFLESSHELKRQLLEIRQWIKIF